MSFNKNCRTDGAAVFSARKVKNMKKILIIGCPGSGKSRFARSLHAATGIKLIHLDLLYWNSDGTVVDKPIFRARLADALAGESWIIDGNYRATMEIRMQACDTVFFFDLPTEVCLAGIRERRGQPRPDMPCVTDENDAEFLDSIRRYNTDNRPKVLELLERYSDRKIVIFRSRGEADDYLKSGI